MGDHPAFAGILKPASRDAARACIVVQKAYRGYADRTGAALLELATRGSPADFAALRTEVERREGPLNPARRGQSAARAGMPKQPRAAAKAASGSAKKKKPQSKVQSRTAKSVRVGVYRDMRGSLTLDDNLSANAQGFLMSQSVAEGTKRTYDTAFIHWIIWRRSGESPTLLERSRPDEWEDELCEFYAHMGHTMGYSWSYCHSMLYAIRRVHRLARINLDLRDDAMPLLSMLRKGLKRKCGAPKRKIPVTKKLMLEVYVRGGLDLESYDGALTWFAILMGFYFLLRSSEYLRKGGEVDQQKCLRWRNITWAINNSTDDAPPGIDCDEVVVFHEFSKNDFLGQGTDNNIKKCSDTRMCIPTWLNTLRRLNPAVFKESRSDEFMLTMTDGTVLPKVVIERLLKEASTRLGLDPRLMSSHSLRAGGCTAMYNAKFDDHEIQRRGRWVSNCWKIYAWSSRRRDNDCAERMTQVDVELYATM